MTDWAGLRMPELRGREKKEGWRMALHWTRSWLGLVTVTSPLLLWPSLGELMESCFTLRMRPGTALTAFGWSPGKYKSLQTTADCTAQLESEKSLKYKELDLKVDFTVDDKYLLGRQRQVCYLI